MRRLIGMFFVAMMSIVPGLSADEDVVGFWKTVNEETGKPESIVGIYPYQGKIYGRILITLDENGQVSDTIYSPKERAPGIVGNPPYAGLDIIYDLQPNGSRYSGGKIVDPEKGRVYNAEMWTQDGNLIVRGEVWMFGRNEQWPPATDSDFPPDFKKPDLTTLVPSIPQVIHGHPAQSPH